jgi:hypothetical protein
MWQRHQVYCVSYSLALGSLAERSSWDSWSRLAELQQAIMDEQAQIFPLQYRTNWFAMESVEGIFDPFQGNEAGRRRNHEKHKTW